VAGAKVNHSPTSRDEVKNEWRCISSSHTCLHGVDKVKSLLLFFNKQVLFGLTKTLSTLTF
jgi:hypothetical protein